MIPPCRSEDKWNEAEASLGECLEIRQEALAEGHWLIFNTMSVLGEALAGQGADRSLALDTARKGQALGARIEKLREAEPLLLEGYERVISAAETIPAPIRDQRIREALQRIVKLYDARHAAEPDKGYDAKAAEWRAKLPEENGE